MKEWKIQQSYKLDLACFLNLFFQDPMGIERHKDGYAHFQQMIEARQDFVTFAKSLLEQGVMVGCTTATVLSLIEYNGSDINEICRIFDDQSMHSVIEEYAREQNMPPEMFQSMVPLLPVLSEMLHYAHDNGFYEYWIENCLPAIESKARDFEQACEKYPVITEVNGLLGFESIKKKFVTLYLCSFSAPYGVGLRNAFISDIRWSFESTVDVAVHELIHPPFSRKIIEKMTQTIWEDEFVKQAKAKLPPSSGYHLPENFIEENLVEGTHVYLSEELGINENPLQYFIEHDHGSHVVSVILYDALKKGYRERAATIQEVVEMLLEDGTLVPGRIRSNYERIYAEAGMGECHPFNQE